EISFPKKGQQSVGVALQTTYPPQLVKGPLFPQVPQPRSRRINCQIGLFLGYSSRHGHALLDRELYLPPAWLQDNQRRTVARIPDHITYASKAELIRRMLQRLQVHTLPYRWIVGGPACSVDLELQGWLEQEQQPFVLDLVPEGQAEEEEIALAL